MTKAKKYKEDKDRAKNRKRNKIARKSRRKNHGRASR